jgi:hypothetical protein
LDHSPAAEFLAEVIDMSVNGVRRPAEGCSSAGDGAVFDNGLKDSDLVRGGNGTAACR